jgi:hypothetical protein
MEGEGAGLSHRGGDEEMPAPSSQTPFEARPILEGPGSRIGPYKLFQEIGE